MKAFGVEKREGRGGKTLFRNRGERIEERSRLSRCVDTQNSIVYCDKVKT
jgi:hypothetical protein